MLRTIKDLEGYTIRATDGNIGDVIDVYFDDHAWGVRYLVVETGTWLSSRKVLLSPITLGQLNWADKELPVLLTKDQVKSSPDIDTDKPVSRQQEMLLLKYYGYPYYWRGAGMWGFGSQPYVESPELAEANAQAQAKQHENDDLHLRSGKAVIGYHIQASDGDIGHVAGLVVDEKTWAIRYLIVDTSNWWFGHQVLIAPQWIQEVIWPDGRVSVNLTRQAVQDAPPYNPAVKLDRKAEMAIHKHYRRSGYWLDEEKREAEKSHF